MGTKKMIGGPQLGGAQLAPKTPFADLKIARNAVHVRKTELTSRSWIPFVDLKIPRSAAHMRETRPGIFSTGIVVGHVFLTCAAFLAILRSRKGI